MRPNLEWNDFPAHVAKTCPFQDGRPCEYHCKLAVQLPIENRSKLYDPYEDFDCSMQLSHKASCTVSRDFKDFVSELRLPPHKRKPLTQEEKDKDER